MKVKVVYFMGHEISLKLEDIFFTLNNGFLPEFITFSLLGKLLKGALKWPVKAISEGKTKMVVPALKYDRIEVKSVFL